MNKTSIGAITKINDRLAVILGDSKSLHLEALREKGCIGTNKFSHLSVFSEDPEIKNDKILIFRCNYEMYHNYTSSSEDLLIYKYLDDDEGAKCIRLGYFFENHQIPDVNELSESAKIADNIILNPVISSDL